MPKATLTLKDGAKVTIEGTSKQVRDLLGKLQGTPKQAITRPATGQLINAPGRSRASTRSGPQALVEDLIEDGYFRTPRNMADIQARLRERGYVLEQTALSAPLLRLTKRRKLKRTYEKDGWAYSV